MFGRLVMSDLRHWAESPTRKPLVLRGARQVGKSTLVKEFGKEFDVFISLNLERREHRDLFAYDIDDVVQLIFVKANKSIDSNKRTLLFIDEIQNSPQAVALLRYFYEDYPWLYVIAAGSLLVTLLDQHVSFPVGRVQYMHLSPCSFSDFLGAMNQTMLKQNVENLSVSEAMHPMVMDMFSKFALVGGMPEAVAMYAENRDIVAVSEVYANLLRSYSEDVERYARNNEECY